MQFARFLIILVVIRISALFKVIEEKIGKFPPHRSEHAGRDAGGGTRQPFLVNHFLGSRDATDGSGEPGRPTAGREGDKRTCAAVRGARPSFYLAEKSSRTTTVGSRTWKVKDSRKNRATFSVSWEA